MIETVDAKKNNNNNQISVIIRDLFFIKNIVYHFLYNIS